MMDAEKRPNLLYQTPDELFAKVEEAAEDIETRPERPMGALDFVVSLLRSETPEDAVTFASYILPHRHCVWWGHECLRQLEPLLSDDDQQMLALAVAWVREPSEETRCAAMDAGMEIVNKTPGTWIALGAGWSGGSMSPPKYQPVPPPSFLTARAVNAGVLSVLALVGMKERRAMLDTFAQMAISIAQS